MAGAGSAGQIGRTEAPAEQRQERQEVIVFVARRRDGHVLILRRNVRHGGVWHGVSGAVEPNETMLDAALRELAEETRLGSSDVTFGGSTRYRYRRPVDESGV